MALYVKKYSRFPKYINVRGFEIPIPLPDKPPAKDFRNYGKPLKEQKFSRDECPKDIMTWDALKREKFIAEQWHKRKNGEWWLIKGQEVYVTGTAWFFFNHWLTESGVIAEFRMEAVEWFLVWDFVKNDPSSMGLMGIKPRRAGDTEKAWCAGYEFVTMYYDSHLGSQNYNREQAAASFKRVVKAHQNMPIWFKPINTGSDAPEQELTLKYPSKIVTHKRMQEAEESDEDTQEQAVRELNSMVSHRPTMERAYDGMRLRYYYLDEPCKIMPKEMDVMKQWGIVKLCLTKYNAMTIVGKAVFTTSVEDIKNGETVKVGQALWRSSDPALRDSLGRTPSGLYRYFRDFVASSAPDEWGFYNEEKATRERDAYIQNFMRTGDFIGLAAFRRQFPASIEEALSVPEADCVLHPHLLDAQKIRLEDYKAKNREAASFGERQQYPECVRGDFLWTSGFGSPVRFVSNPSGGKFYISGHPDVPNNWRVSGGTVMPGNRGIYSVGVDSVDHARGAQKRGSDIAISVYRVFNPMDESGYVEWENGEIMNKWAMRTGKFVCTYSFKPMKPEDGWEDVLKCLLYYGAPALIEKDKPGVIRYIMGRGFAPFLNFPTKDIMGRWQLVNADPGLNQKASIINQWVPLLQNHVADYIETYTHEHQIANFRNFTGDNRTESDLVVASGLALLDARKYEDNEKRNLRKMDTHEGFAFPFDIVNTHN